MKSFVSFEYKEILVDNERVSLYIDCYENFGWVLDDNINLSKTGTKIKITLKRDRKISNKMELTRLQNHFESVVNELKIIDNSKHRFSTIVSVLLGLIGTLFLAGAVFAILHNPPIFWLFFLLEIPGIIGWVTPVFVYRLVYDRQNKKLAPLLEEKYDEIFNICEKGANLL